MRILVSLENNDSLSELCGNICSLLRIIEESTLYIDVLHVYKPSPTRKHGATVEELEEIRKDEHKLKVKSIAAWENHIENYLQDSLDKSALVNSYLLEGDFKEKILRHITFQRYDLLILNPGKKKNMEVVLNGRNTYWVIDNLEIPVLVLPDHLSSTSDSKEYEISCFVDELNTFNSLKRSDLLKNFFQTKINYIHFGRDQFHEEVEVINSSNPLSCMTDRTKTGSATQIFVLNHKNKGNFLNFLDKSFTKNIIKSLNNPLLIY